MKFLIILIWVIDVLNIGNNINGFDLVRFLDETLPINFWGWFLIIFLTGLKVNINVN